MLHRTATWLARHPGRIVWVLVGAAVVGLGLWGFRNLEPPPPAGTLTLLLNLFHALANKGIGAVPWS